jgi:hypothetical protein
MTRLRSRDGHAVRARLGRDRPRLLRVGGVDREGNWKLARRHRPVRMFCCSR